MMLMTIPQPVAQEKILDLASVVNPLDEVEDLILLSLNRYMTNVMHVSHHLNLGVMAAEIQETTCLLKARIGTSAMQTAMVDAAPTLVLVMYQPHAELLKVLNHAHRLIRIRTTADSTPHQWQQKHPQDPAAAVGVTTHAQSVGLSHQLPAPLGLMLGQVPPRAAVLRKMTALRQRGPRRAARDNLLTRMVDRRRPSHRRPSPKVQADLACISTGEVMALTSITGTLLGRPINRIHQPL
jgi:hypothetical protein